MNVKIKTRRLRNKGTQLTHRTAVEIDGKEAGAVSFWPDSPASCDAADSEVAAILKRAGLNSEQRDQVYLGAWNNG